MSEDADKAAGKQRGKPFQKGQSGNPNGRKLGSRNRASIIVERLLDGEAEKLTRRLIERALEGNTEAMGIVFARLCPARKDRAVRFDLPAIKTVEDIGTALESLNAQVAAGDLTPLEGQQVAALIEARRRIVETVELEARVAALEAAQPKGPAG